MIAVVVAVAAVVTLVAVTHLGNEQSTFSLNDCRSAASACKASTYVNPLDQCTSCDTSCKANDGTEVATNAVKCCKLGQPNSIYSGATGTDCSGCLDTNMCTNNQVCNPSTHACVECLDDNKCAPKVCNLDTHTCVECTDSSQCTNQVCNPDTHACVTPACSLDSDCTLPIHGPTGDDACTSNLCKNPGAYNAVCVANGKNSPPNTYCQTTYSDWTCTNGNTAFQRTKTTFTCSGSGLCNVGTPSTELRYCPMTTNTYSCTDPIPGHPGFGYNQSVLTTTYLCDPSTIATAGSCTISTASTTNTNCQVWGDGSPFAACYYCYVDRCIVPWPSLGCSIGNVNCVRAVGNNCGDQCTPYNYCISNGCVCS